MAAAWAEIVDGFMQRLPTPLSYTLVPDGEIAVLLVALPGHVAPWAEFLDLPAPSTYVAVLPGSGGALERVTVTRSAGQLTPDTWISIDHCHRELVDAETTGEAPCEASAREL
jgi:hypothetical protein